MLRSMLIAIMVLAYLGIPISGFAGDTEKTIVISCGFSSNGQPYAWALCTAGKLTEEEARKCLNGEGCYGKNNAIRQAMEVVATQLPHVLGISKREDHIHIVNMTEMGMAFSLTGSDPITHGTHKTRAVVLQPGQGSLFHMNSTKYFVFQIRGQQWQMENRHSYSIVENPDSSAPHEMQFIPKENE